MPKAKKEQAGAQPLYPPASSAVSYHLPPPLQYTPFQPLLSINGKNVASNFGKSDVQLWWTRRADDELWEGQRGWKRSVMMGDETRALLRRPPREPQVVNGIPRTESKGKQKAMDGMRVGEVEGSRSHEAPHAHMEQEVPALVDPASRVIIIHPGARTVRVGRASDLAPVSVPNVVARKCTDPARCGVGTDFEPPHDDESKEAYEGKIAAIRADLRSRMRILKLRGTTNGQGLAAAYNAEVVPEELSDVQDPFEGAWTPLDGRDTYIGKDALALSDAEANGYTVRWPLKEGTFNARAEAGYVSKSEILADIEAVWLHAITMRLGIAETDLKDYSVILVIPDLYDHVYLREMIDLLFRCLGFKQILLQQESLCACFGAGLGTACVVDIGATKTSIACVEEGSILPDTRLHLAFGGDDITVVLTELLRRQSLPCAPIDLDSPWDFATMDDIKEQIVVLSEGDVGLNVYSSFKRRLHKPTVKFEVRVYDEVIIAPMALFAPRIIDFDRKMRPGPHLFSTQAELDDVLDLGGSAVTEAMRNCTAHLTPAAYMPTSNTAAINAGAGSGTQSVIENSLTVVPPPEIAMEESGVSIPSTPNAGAETAIGLPSMAQTRMPTPDIGTSAVETAVEASKIPLHVAIAESILASGSEERARRMLGALMVVGGGGHIHNVGYAIASRVQAIVASRWPTVGECVVVPPPRDIDPRELVWKGVALMSRLDAINDLWIRTSDFEALGYKAVRERLLL